MSVTRNPQDPMDSAWLGLAWSAWMPLMAAHPLALAQLPSEIGVYRIRSSRLPSVLLWSGWAAAGVRETVERLSRQVHMPVPPFDDGIGPARMLWTLRCKRAESFEVSGAAASHSVDLEAALAECIRQTPSPGLELA